MSGVEKRYAQIEKEALATTWACERYSNFLIRKTFHIETDHRPLVSLMGQKTLDELPSWMQRFRMRLMRFRYSISHVLGGKLADTLSRAPVVESQQPENKSFQDQCQGYENAVMCALPVTDKQLLEIKQLSSSWWCNMSERPGILHARVATQSETGVWREAVPSGCRRPHYPKGIATQSSRLIIPVAMQKTILGERSTKDTKESRNAENVRNNPFGSRV